MVLQIGQGTYSSVYRARDVIHDKIVALKKVLFDNQDPESVKFMAREIAILRKLDHPNIIKLEGLITSQTSCSLYLVFEYMEHDLVGLTSLPGMKFTESQVAFFFLSSREWCEQLLIFLFFQYINIMTPKCSIVAAVFLILQVISICPYIEFSAILTFILLG